MKIKLISPRSSVRPMDSAWKTRMSPPLPLLVLGALTPPQHEVVLADENVERVRYDDNPDLVGITVKVDTLYRAAEIARQYRRRGIPVVMGGIHATACPDDCRRIADSVVVGEAESIWRHLLTDVERGHLRRRYENGGPVDIAWAPIPRWPLLHSGRYLFTNTLRIGRGCPWRCDFCYNSAPNVDARYRMKPIRNIIAEIESLGVRHVMFIDDNFIGNPARARALLTELRKMDLIWHTAVSADIGRHADLLDLMAESGCKSLFIGFESVNPANLRECHKAQNRREEYERTIAGIHQRGMMVNASLVFGFDEDTSDVFAATVRWLVQNHIATMTAHILTPYPGTRLYDDLLAQGRIIDNDLRRYNTAYCVFKPKRMTPRELEAGYRWAYREFYSWPNIIRRRPVAAGQLKAYLEFNLVYRKYGKLTCLLGKAVGMRILARLARMIAYPHRRSAAAWRIPHPARTVDTMRHSSGPIRRA